MANYGHGIINNCPQSERCMSPCPYCRHLDQRFTQALHNLLGLIDLIFKAYEQKAKSIMVILRKLSMAVVGAAVVAFGTSSAAHAGSFVSTSTGQVGTVDQATGGFTQVASGPAFTDIALSNTGNLFGITFNQLFSINQSSGTSSLIGNLGDSMNGLGFSTSNELYGTGSSGFYKVNTTTGAVSLVANISGFLSSGDIVFDPLNNRFLATSLGSGSDSLFSIALNGAASKIGNIGFSNVYGLFFDNGTLFGYTADRKQLTIDLATGAATFNKNVTGVRGEIYGAASLPSTGPKSVPEPATVFGLLGVGTLGAGSRLKRKKEHKA